MADGFFAVNAEQVVYVVAYIASHMPGIPVKSVVYYLYYKFNRKETR